MALALPGVYLYAFHQPQPHEMPVEIIGANHDSAQLALGLATKMAPSFRVTSVADADTARRHLTDMSSRGAFDPATGTLYVASAGSPLAESAVQTAFGAVARQLGTELTVRDVAPLPESDRVGVSLLFVGLAAILAGFVTATVLNVAVPGLSLRAEIAILGLVALVAAVITTFIAYSAYGALSGHLVEVALLAASGTICAGLLQSGGIKLIGPGMTVVGVTVLIILGIPASGIAVPVDMVPPVFAHLHSWLPTSAVLDGLRRTLYFGGSGIDADLPIIGLWIALGAGAFWLSTLRSPKTSAVVAEQEGAR
ncbi:hypothetical protein C5E45_31085 [Nocardia nova]|uniref:ABC transporter permease n=2 Tax=Nocardia nova TaxID=37330 RepID=A0A2S6AGS0_9NOCA|nr:hypothetical protein C5E41_29425 [Nocardia nova]PPJ33966.1 hypothetical protein C5E45_31085 [Nocardia nova]